MSDKETKDNNNNNDSNTRNNNNSVSEDILNVIQSGQVKSSTSNKLHLLMDSSSSEEEGEEEISTSQAKPTTTSIKSLKKKKAEYIDSEEEGNGGFLSDGYDVDLYGDEEDRARLFAMTEVEREAILYERAQARQARRERRALEQRIREQEERASGVASSTRRSPSKEVDLKRKKLDELKAKRMKKQLNVNDEEEDDEEEGEFEDSEEESEEEYARRRRAKAKRSNRRAKREDSDEDYYTEDSEEEGGVERNRRRSKKLSGKRSQQASQSDEDESVDAGVEAVTELDLDLANKLRLTRDIISQWIYRDGFEEICQKSLLRINLGTGKTGQPTYRVVEVKRIVQHHRTYQIKPGVPTNLAALVKFAKSERTFTFEYVSNSPFTPEEFKYWKLECERAGVRLPYNSTTARRKIDKFKAFHSEPLTDAVIEKILERRSELTSAQNAPRNLLAEQTILQQQLKEALERQNNEEEVSRIEAELQAISLKRQQSSESRIDRLAGMEDLNRRNRLVNLETGRQAEISRLQSELVPESGVSSPRAAATLDPFQRRKCKPSIIHMGEKDEDKNVGDNNKVDGDDKSGEKNSEKKSSENNTEKNNEKNTENSTNNNLETIPTTATKNANSLFDAHNFDLDLDI